MTDKLPTPAPVRASGEPEGEIARYYWPKDSQPSEEPSEWFTAAIRDAFDSGRAFERAAASVPSPPAQEALEALEFAHGAILDAIGAEDGLDSVAGEKVLVMIRAALTVNGRTPPDMPAADVVVEPLPIWTAASVLDARQDETKRAEDIASERENYGFDNYVALITDALMDAFQRGTVWALPSPPVPDSPMQHKCPEFGECHCEYQPRGTGVDRGRTVVSGPSSDLDEGAIHVYSHDAPTYLCAECRHQWQASHSSYLVASSAPVTPSSDVQVDAGAEPQEGLQKELQQLLADADEIRSACGFMWMRMAVAENVQDAYDVAKREFETHEAAFKRLETALPRMIRAVSRTVPAGEINADVRTVLRQFEMRVYRADALPPGNHSPKPTLGEWREIAQWLYDVLAALSASRTEPASKEQE